MQELTIIHNNNDLTLQGPAIDASAAVKFIAYLDASPASVATYRRAIRQFMKYLGANGIIYPSRADILAYRDQLKETHKPSTVQSYITAVRLFFQWLEQEGIYKNVAAHVKGAKLDREQKKDYLTSRQVKQVMEVAKGETVQALRNYAMLALMFTAGLRTIEVSRADVADLRTRGDKTVLYIQGKGHTEKAVYVDIAPEVEDAIRAYLTARGPVLMNAPLFTSTSHNSSGERLTTRSISGIVKATFKAAGYDSDRLTAHSTRHTAVTLALLGGESIQQASKFARHASISTTMVYAHNLERANNTCTSTVAKAIF